jgi:cell division protein FtsL
MEKSSVRLPGTLAAALGMALLLAALSLVTWRQARAREALADLDGLRRELSLMAAERNDLGNRIQVLESRGRVVPAARDGLGMRTPDGAEIVWLAGVDEARAEADARR